MLRTVVFLLAVLSCSGRVSAQDVHPYVGGAIEVSSFGTHSWDGSPSLTYNNATDDTVVTSIAGEGGVFLRNNVAVGVELSIPFERSNITQSHGYFNPFNRRSRYREWSVSGIFHGYMPTGRRVRAGIVAGGGMVFASSRDQVSTCNFDPRIPCAPFSAEREATHSAFAAVVGSDVAVQITRRLSVVPQFRVVWVGRGGDPASSSFDADFDFVTLGLDRLACRAALGLRATF
jgi:hypothetical protein